MQYRKMGSLGWEVSALGFGAMRLPVKDSWGRIDEQKAGDMLRYAIDQGINYVDTAWPYHEENSEKFVGKMLKNGYREKVNLATKCPIWLVDSPKSFHSYFDQQRKKLETDYIDIYLFHGLNDAKWNNLQQLHLLDEMELLRSTNNIRSFGFSFHGSYDTFKQIIDSYSWEVTMIQYNYLDTDFQATLSGLNYAWKKKIAVVIMEPLRGGKLAQRNREIDSVCNRAHRYRTPAEWALRFVWNHPGVATVLSGMGNIEQVKDNIRYVEDALPGSLSKADLSVIDRLKETYLRKLHVLCTNCQYCMPCPEGVNIPENFNLINHASWEGGVQPWMKKWYNEMEDTNVSTDWHGKGSAGRCIGCGECLDKCPQKIDIPDEMIEVRRVFEEGKAI
jgi:predicted aldo/keto reductase-like oxidoreductase